MTDKKETNSGNLVLVKYFDHRYLINEKGDTYSVFGPHGIRETLKKVTYKKSKDGYLKHTFYGIKKRVKTSQHRLVAVAFLGLDFRDKKKVVNHKDGNKYNNYVGNLEILSIKENAKHAARNKLYNKNMKMTW